jgi:hypothetical protein
MKAVSSDAGGRRAGDVAYAQCHVIDRIERLKG